MGLDGILRENAVHFPDDDSAGSLREHSPTGALPKGLPVRRLAVVAPFVHVVAVAVALGIVKAILPFAVALPSDVVALRVDCDGSSLLRVSLDRAVG